MADQVEDMDQEDDGPDSTDEDTVNRSKCGKVSRLQTLH
jgi:hypothetical protein